MKKKQRVQQNNEISHSMGNVRCTVHVAKAQVYMYLATCIYSVYIA